MSTTYSNSHITIRISVKIVAEPHLHLHLHLPGGDGVLPAICQHQQAVFQPKNISDEIQFRSQDLEASLVCMVSIFFLKEFGKNCSFQES